MTDGASPAPRKRRGAEEEAWRPGTATSCWPSATAGARTAPGLHGHGLGPGCSDDGRSAASDVCDSACQSNSPPVDSTYAHWPKYSARSGPTRRGRFASRRPALRPSRRRAECISPNLRRRVRPRHGWTTTEFFGCGAEDTGVANASRSFSPRRVCLCKSCSYLHYDNIVGPQATKARRLVYRLQVQVTTSAR